MSDQEQLAQDAFEYNTYLFNHISEFFNQKAQKDANPASVKKYEGLSQTFAKAADVMSKLSPHVIPSAPEIAALMKVEKTAKKLIASGEMAEVEEYSLKKMQAFADADPVRWARIEKADPVLAEKTKPYLK